MEITVVLRWETVEINGVKTPIFLKPVKKPRWSVGGLPIKVTEVETQREDEKRYAILHFHGDHPELKSGLRSDWVTADPE